MEKYLRDLIRKYPDGGFEALYVGGQWQPTRTNVLDPNSIGCYVAGRSYNPRKPLRTKAVTPNTEWLDKRLEAVTGEPPYIETTTDEILSLIKKVKVDPASAELWDIKAIEAALDVLKGKNKEKNKADKVYLVVKRDRNLRGPRTERQGILHGEEAYLAPSDAPTLFMYRINKNDDDEVAVWWPQLRFPEGNYVIAFSFKW